MKSSRLLAVAPLLVFAPASLAQGPPLTGSGGYGDGRNQPGPGGCTYGFVGAARHLEGPTFTVSVVVDDGTTFPETVFTADPVVDALGMPVVPARWAGAWQTGAFAGLGACGSTATITIKDPADSGALFGETAYPVVVAVPVEDNFGVKSNNIPLNNSAEGGALMSVPSVGSPLGTSPPDVFSDLFWKVYSGDRIMRHNSGSSGISVMEIDGYFETIWDTDWATPADFYDRTHGPVLPSTTVPGLLEPAFFQNGITTETLVSLGNSGFGNPCTVFPSLCSPPGGSCAPIGFANGYIVDIQLGETTGTGIACLADGSTAAGLATTYFLPGGMPFTGGPCLQGDYVIQNLRSTDEDQADDLFGISAFGGQQFAGGGPVADLVTEAPEVNVNFRNTILNVVGDSDGLGLDVGNNGGGALNGLKLNVGGGSAQFGIEVRDLAGTAQFAACGASLLEETFTIPLLGGYLQVALDPLFFLTLQTFNGPVVQSGGEGSFASPPIPLPAGLAGVTFFIQGIWVGTPGGVYTARNTNRVKLSLLP